MRACVCSAELTSKTTTTVPIERSRKLWFTKSPESDYHPPSTTTMTCKVPVVRCSGGLPYSWEWRIMIACLIGVFRLVLLAEIFPSFFSGWICMVLGSIVECAGWVVFLLLTMHILRNKEEGPRRRYGWNSSTVERLWVCLLWWKIIDAIVIVTLLVRGGWWVDSMVSGGCLPEKIEKKMRL